MTKKISKVKEDNKEILSKIKEVYKGKTLHIEESNQPLENLFYNIFEFNKAASWKDADIIVFSGGTDINPKLYGQERISKCGSPNDIRDLREFMIYKASKDKMKWGICRGSQFLNAMNGGTLWQHVDNHTGDHEIVDVDTGRVFNATSTHHQQMIPNFKDWNFMPIAVACNKDGDMTTLCKDKMNALKTGTNLDGSKHKMNLSDLWTENNSIWVDFEAIYYAETKSLCYQPHPEYLMLKAGEDTMKYYAELIYRAGSEDQPFTTMPEFLVNAYGKRMPL